MPTYVGNPSQLVRTIKTDSVETGQQYGILEQLLAMRTSQLILHGG